MRQKSFYGVGKPRSHAFRSFTRQPDAPKTALVLTAAYMVAEAVGGWLANSLALLADAGHMLTDVAALSLTLFAFWFAARPATSKKTYGYYRLEILVAFVNGVVLALLSLWVIYEAAGRWKSPPEIKASPMLLIAAGGLAVNIFTAFLLHSGHKHDLNMRGAFLHVMGDLLGSVAAIIAGVLIIVFGWLWADAVSSVLISAIIIVGSLAADNRIGQRPARRNAVAHRPFGSRGRDHGD